MTPFRKRLVVTVRVSSAGNLWQNDQKRFCRMIREEWTVVAKFTDTTWDDGSYVLTKQVWAWPWENKAQIAKRHQFQVAA